MPQETATSPVPTTEGNPAGETQQRAQEKSFLARQAEKARNLAVKLKDNLKRNPQNAQNQLIELARGTDDPAINNQRERDVRSFLLNGLPQPDAARAEKDTTEAKTPADENVDFTAATDTKSSVAPADSESAGQMSEPPSGSAGTETQNPEAQQIDTATNEATSPTVEATAEDNQQKVAQLVQRLNEVDGDFSQLSNTELQTLKKIMGTQIASQEAKNSEKPKEESVTVSSVADLPEAPASDTQSSESTRPTDAASARETAVALGVDPESEAGVKFFDLIDSSTPDALLGLWDKVTTAEGATDLAMKYFSEHGFKGSLNPKNLFKFALGEIVAEQQNIKGDQPESEVTGETNEKTEAKTKLRTKIMEMLVALAMALGAVAVEAFKGGSESIQDSIKK